MRAGIQIKMIADLERAREEMAKIGADPAGIEIMLPKALFHAVKISGVASAAANILKQEILAKGGEAVVAKQVITGGVTHSDVLLLATRRQYQLLISKIKNQPFGLKTIAVRLEQVLNNLNTDEKAGLDCRGKFLPLGKKTLIMGILNLTPDSFSDGGSYDSLEAVIRRAKEMEAEGADLLDVGAESTRPGGEKISSQEEMARLRPVLPLLSKELKIPLSLDTYKAEVAEMGLQLGVHLLNDIWGLQGDPEMVRVATRYQSPVIIMHNQEGTEYRDLLTEVNSFLEKSIEIAEQAGLSRNQLIVDPGIGFGKTMKHNLEIMNRLGELKGLGCPILVGTSRKSFIGKVLELPVHEREEGTAATAALAVAGGADIVRVHNVKMIAKVVKMADAVVRWKHG